MTTYRVGYLVGSLAKASINRKLALALAHLAPEELRMEEISFAELPLYSYDFDADFPPGGEVTDDETAEFLRTYMADFGAFIQRVYTALPRTPGLGARSDCRYARLIFVHLFFGSNAASCSS